ncbi:MAG: hypothetical protein HWE16_08260 [Gammaproteobacteria bacterium]|nr:hypothetical protein [Gammaproteobacteria bacterium]
MAKKKNKNPSKNSQLNKKANSRLKAIGLKNRGTYLFKSSIDDLTTIDKLTIKNDELFNALPQHVRRAALISYSLKNQLRNLKKRKKRAKESRQSKKEFLSSESQKVKNNFLTQLRNKNLTDEQIHDRIQELAKEIQILESYLEIK